jgi:PAS domain S-box-containing protein
LSPCKLSMNNSTEDTATFSSTPAFASLVHVLSNASDSVKAMAEAVMEISELSSSDLIMIVQKSDLNILHDSIAFSLQYMRQLEDLDENDTLVKVLRNNWTHDKEFNNPGYFSGHTDSYKGTELGEALAEKQVSSFLILPISKKANQWGYLCLFEIDAPRLWSNDFIEAMKSVTSILAFFLNNLELSDELHRKELYLKQAVESSNDGNWEMDLMNNSIHFSRQWKAMLGYSDKDLKDEFETFEDLLHPDDRDIVLAVLDPYTKVGLGDYECQYRLRTQRGTYKWVLTRASVLNNNDGLPERFVATNIDVTTRVKFAESLRKEERKYEDLIDSVQEIIFKTDHQGVFTFINSAWERSTGFNPSQIIGQSCIDYIYHEDRELTQKKMKELAAGQSDVNEVFEMRFLTKSGNTVWVEANIAARKTPEGDVEEFYGTFFDIQRRKSAEFSSTYSEEKFTSISDSMADLIVQIDQNGRITFASNASTAIFGAPPDVIKGKKALSFVHPGDRSLVVNEIFSGFRKGSKKIIKEYRIVRVDGKVQWIETLAQPIISQEGEITYLAVIRDIELRKKTEDEIRRNLLQEKRLSELKSRFLTMTSHEFRTPLSSIKSSIELLDMYTSDLDEKKQEAFQKHFNRMISQIDRIDGLLDSIHIVGQSQSDQLDFSPEMTNLEKFIEDVVKKRLDYQDERGIKISVSGASRNVKVDQHHLLVAVKNVMVNALTFSRGAPPPTCEIVYKEDHFCIVVEDFGVGIPENELDKVFESFYRAQNIINENIPGNGLGLMIALRMVREHNGDIAIQSEAGKGTTVSICIPYQ